MRIGVFGCAGRMGRMLVAEIAKTEGCLVSGGTERPGAKCIGQDVGALAGIDALGVPVIDNAETLIHASDAVIDFTAPAITVTHAALAARHGKILVIGTTGLDQAQEAILREASKRAVIVQAPNMSVGVTLLAALTETVARTLGIDYDIEIVEMHHRHKVDAPSGTALALGRAAAKGREIALDTVAQKVRDGIIGPRPPGEIGFATLRGGDVVGEHTVVFAGEGERIELTHKASSRQVFARGAVRAVLWAAQGKPCGLYTMRDVLGIS